MQINKLLSPRHRFGSDARDIPVVSSRFNPQEGLIDLGQPDYWFGGGPMEGNSGDALYDADGNRVDRYAGRNGGGARRPLTDEEAAALLGTVEPYDFTGSPGYQFRLNEGLRAIENGLIGRGLGLSGRGVKAAERFGQDYAADEFNAEFARNATLAGFTPPSIGSMNALINNFANGAGNLALGQGQNSANSAYMNANVNSNLFNNLIQVLGQYMPNNTRPPYETYSTPVSGSGAPF